MNLKINSSLKHDEFENWMKEGVYELTRKRLKGDGACDGARMVIVGASVNLKWGEKF